MAGIYSTWTDPNGEELGTYAVLTIDSHSRTLHSRLARPIILHPDDEAAWLDPEVSDMVSLYGMMKSYTDDVLTIHQVSEKVHSRKANSPDLISPIGSA